MVLPKGLARVNAVATNKVLRLLVGIGPMAEIEHIGRTSGTVYHTPVVAFRGEAEVSIALTYGADVDWLKNLRAAGGGRMRLGRDLLRLGPPELLGADGAAKVPALLRPVLRTIGVGEFTCLPVVQSRHRTH